MVLGYGQLVSISIDCASGRHENNSLYSRVSAFVEQIQREEEVGFCMSADVEVGGRVNTGPGQVIHNVHTFDRLMQCTPVCQVFGYDPDRTIRKSTALNGCAVKDRHVKIILD